MKTIILNTTTLTTAVATANNYLTKEGDFAGAIVLTGNDRLLSVMATSHTETISLNNIPFNSTDMTLESFEDFSINGKNLLTALKACKSDEVSIDITEDKITVKSGRSKAKIDIHANTQEIYFPECEDKFFIGSDLVIGLQKTQHAIDTNNPKYELNGALIEVSNGKLKVVSTDTRRLAVSTSDSSLGDMSLIIAKPAVQSILKLFGESEISAKRGKESLVIMSENITYSTKLISGKFPNWEAIIQDKWTHSVKLSASLLNELVKEASIFDDSVVVNIYKDKIVVTDADENTVVTEEIQSDVAFRFGLNSKIISEYIASVDEEVIELRFSYGRPMTFIASDAYQEVCMPDVSVTEPEVNDEEFAA